MGEASAKWQVLSATSTVPFCELTFVSGLYLDTLCVHTHVLVRRERAELLGFFSQLRFGY